MSGKIARSRGELLGGSRPRWWRARVGWLVILEERGAVGSRQLQGMRLPIAKWIALKLRTKDAPPASNSVLDCFPPITNAGKWDMVQLKVGIRRHAVACDQDCRAGAQRPHLLWLRAPGTRLVSVVELDLPEGGHRSDPLMLRNLCPSKSAEAPPLENLWGSNECKNDLPSLPVQTRFRSFRLREFRLEM